MPPYSTFENSISEGNHDSLQILGKKEARLETNDGNPTSFNKLYC